MKPPDRVVLLAVALISQVASVSAQALMHPDEIRVDPAKFPKFKVTAVATPPRWTFVKDPTKKSRFPMVDILPSDEWRVTHQIGEILLIGSETYNQRQCEALAAIAPNGAAGGFKSPVTGKCTPDYLYLIYVSPEGQISGGWKLIRNIGFRTDQMTTFSPTTQGNEGWESITFEKIP